MISSTVVPNVPASAAAVPTPPEEAAPAPPVRRAPSSLSVPSVDDGSAAASAALHQTASYVGLLSTALGQSPDAYARVVKQGFLEDAISYSQYAHALLEYDKSLDNDGFAGMVEGAVMEALRGVRAAKAPITDVASLADELSMAGAAASNAAAALALLAGRKA